jgi:transcription-repair coupling factor (superfamily II helicase)
MKPEDLFLGTVDLDELLEMFPRVALQSTVGEVDFGVSILQAGPDAAGAALAESATDDDRRFLFVAESAGRREALLDWLRPRGVQARAHADWPAFAADRNRYGIVIGPLQEGLRVSAALTIIAEAQIFGERAAPVLRKRGKVRDPETILRDLNDLKIGAPVVHVEHGVGRYLGLQRLDAGGIEAEYLMLEYSGGDKLYVPVASLNLIHRYTGAEAETAPLHSLGSERWSKAQSKARERAADVAAELLQIQARRAARPAEPLRADPADYAAFAADFPFETTPDQQTAIDAVLAISPDRRRWIAWSAVTSASARPRSRCVPPSSPHRPAARSVCWRQRPCWCSNTKRTSATASPIAACASPVCPA